MYIGEPVLMKTCYSEVESQSLSSFTEVSCSIYCRCLLSVLLLPQALCKLLFCYSVNGTQLASPERFCIQKIFKSVRYIESSWKNQNFELVRARSFECTIQKNAEFLKWLNLVTFLSGRITKILKFIRQLRQK